MSLITDLQKAANLKLAAAELQQIPRRVLDHDFPLWEKGMDIIWASESPAAVLSELGPTAAAIVSGHAAMVALLEAGAPGCTADRVAAMPAYTVHEDGTVTINES